MADKIVIREILIKSLFRLYEVDYSNIRYGVSERNICARLALHIEHYMRIFDSENDSTFFLDYYADVEYNRMGNGDLKHYESSAHRPVYMVSDLLIQRRGEGRNYLAVEMKRRGNYRGAGSDKERLKRIVSSPSNDEEFSTCVYDTLLGAFIMYSPKEVVIELFENVNGQGEKTDEIHFHYSTDRRKLVAI